MVRLKVKPESIETLMLSIFQFLSGAIKSSTEIGDPGTHIAFQFLSGAIKRKITISVDEPGYINFNS